MTISHCALKLFLPAVKDLLVFGWSSLLEEIGWVELDDSLSQGEDIPSDQELGMYLCATVLKKQMNGCLSPYQ